MQRDRDLKIPLLTVFKTILIIHFALLLGQVMFAAVTFYLQGSKAHLEINTGDVFTYVVSTLAIVGFVLSNFLNRLQLNTIQTDATPTQKLVKYQTAMILKLAVLEGPSLLGISVFFITGNLFFLIISGVIMLYFVLLTPTKERVFNDAKFNYDERF